MGRGCLLNECKLNILNEVAMTYLYVHAGSHKRLQNWMLRSLKYCPYLENSTDFNRFLE